MKNVESQPRNFEKNQKIPRKNNNINKNQINFHNILILKKNKFASPKQKKILENTMFEKSTNTPPCGFSPPKKILVRLTKVANLF